MIYDPQWQDLGESIRIHWKGQFKIGIETDRLEIGHIKGSNMFFMAMRNWTKDLVIKIEEKDCLGKDILM